MPDIPTTTYTFRSEDFASPRKLVVETDGGLVTITVGLDDPQGHRVTNISLHPADKECGEASAVWELPDNGSDIIRDGSDPAGQDSTSGQASTSL